MNQLSVSMNLIKKISQSIDTPKSLRKSHSITGAKLEWQKKSMQNT